MPTPHTQGEQWQSFETAPKDREIIVVYPQQGNVKLLVRWNDVHNYWESKGEAKLGIENQGCLWTDIPELHPTPTQEERCVDCGDTRLEHDDPTRQFCVHFRAPVMQTQDTHQPSEGFDMRFFADREKRLLEAGNELADRALYTTREYDGLHRLGSAVAHWVDVVSKLNIPTVNKPSEGWEKEIKAMLHKYFVALVPYQYDVNNEQKNAVDSFCKQEEYLEKQFVESLKSLLTTARREEREELREKVLGLTGHLCHLDMKPSVHRSDVLSLLTKGT